MACAILSRAACDLILANRQQGSGIPGNQNLRSDLGARQKYVTCKTGVCSVNDFYG
jgi:hypothetical protein